MQLPKQPKQRLTRGDSQLESRDLDGDDLAFRALAEPARRRILDLLRQAPMTTGALCEHFDTSRFAVMKHLKVLERAHLVVVERRGRERYNHLNPVPIQQIYRRFVRPFEGLKADHLLLIKQASESTY